MDRPPERAGAVDSAEPAAGSQLGGVDDDNHNAVRA